jgi:hypothetical protein
MTSIEYKGEILSDTLCFKVHAPKRGLYIKSVILKYNQCPSYVNITYENVKLILTADDYAVKHNQLIIEKGLVGFSLLEFKLEAKYDNEINHRVYLEVIFCPENVAKVIKNNPKIYKIKDQLFINSMNKIKVSHDCDVKLDNETIDVEKGYWTNVKKNKILWIKNSLLTPITLQML